MQCSRCGEWKNDEEFDLYFNVKMNQDVRRLFCRGCDGNHGVSLERIYQHRNKINMDWSDTVPRYPNQYDTMGQKRVVANFLTSIGWKFNEENNVWYREPFKLSDGTFPDIHHKKKKCVITDDLIKYVNQLADNKVSVDDIMQKSGMSRSTVYKYAPQTKLSKRGRPKKQ
jgi:hypothetical protein